MFRRRQKRNFPPGTFIPTPARICAIIQLCIAFSLILWDLSEPFTGELFRQKSKALLYEEVMGIAPAENPSQEQRELSERNALRFQRMPEEKRAHIIEGYKKLKIEKTTSFLNKFQRAVASLFFEIPLFERAWLLFSIILPILLLKRTEGASAALWILPLLTFCYSVDNQMHGKPYESQEAQLFPSEKKIIEEYLETPLSRDIFEQQEQLKEGWQLYLIREWTGQEPSNSLPEFKQQVEQGSFAFTVERMEKRLLDDSKASPFQKKNPLLLFLYLFWNLSFAFIGGIRSSPREAPKLA